MEQEKGASGIEEILFLLPPVFHFLWPPQLQRPKERLVGGGELVAIDWFAS